jgi:hypothetical protein
MSIEAPVRDIVEYTTISFPESMWEKSAYMSRPNDGMPTEATDILWNQLFHCKCGPRTLSSAPHPNLQMHIHAVANVCTISYLTVGNLNWITEDEAQQIPNRTAALPESEGKYLMELDVFHQLHCLNILRKSLWPDYYAGHFYDYFGPDGERLYNSSMAHHFGECPSLYRTKKGLFYSALPINTKLALHQTIALRR